MLQLGDNTAFDLWENVEEERSEDTPVSGDYPELARQMRQLLGWYGPGPRMTLRMAARKTKISHTTISGMLQGDRFSMDVTMQVGRGLGLDTTGVNRLLRASNYPQIMDENAGEIVGFIDPADVYVAARDNGMTDREAKELLERIEQRRKEKRRKEGREE